VTLEERKAALRQASVVWVSACLMGERVRYDGKDQRSDAVARALEGKQVVSFCPEAEAGLGIPRPPVQLVGGTGKDVLAGTARAQLVATGDDRTDAFVRGAQLALAAAQRAGATVAILKERSPSCGTQRVWSSGAVVPGEGVTAATFRAAGIVVLSDEEL
jgi:uncharacterized protein YbbK (DUF523 family)